MVSCAHPSDPRAGEESDPRIESKVPIRLEVRSGNEGNGGGAPYDGENLTSGAYWLSLAADPGSEMPAADSAAFDIGGRVLTDRTAPFSVGPVHLQPGTHRIAWRLFGGDYGADTIAILVDGSSRDAAPGGSFEPLDGSTLDRLYGVPDIGDRWRDLGDPAYDSLVFHWGAYHDDRQERRPPGREWEATYYDRGFGWCAAHRRYGGEVWRERCHRTVRHYRDDYVLKNGGRTSPKWMFPEGLAVHYLETGEQASLDALRMMAVEHRNWIDGADDILTTRYRDGRIQGRSILNFIILHELEPEPEYADAVRSGIDRLVTWYDAAGGTGAWDSSALPWSAEPDRKKLSYCGGMATFQVAHAILYAFFRAHELDIYTHPRMREVVTNTLDHMWRHWQPGEGFAYIIPPGDHPPGEPFRCQRSGSDEPAADVSLLIATSFGYGYALTGAARFRERGDAIWRFGVGGSVEFPRIYWKGSKQHNQSIFRAWRYPWLTR